MSEAAKTPEAGRDSPGMPLELKIIAWLFLGVGIYFVFNALVNMMHGGRGLAGFFLVGLIFVGRGLLKGQESQRIWALIYLGVGMLVVAFMLVLVLIYPVSEIEIGDMSLENTPKLLDLLGLALILAAQYWQFRVLMRPDIRALFRFHCLDNQPAPETAPPSGEDAKAE